ncbi:hypothetical protein [Rhizobium leguminosarum]|uniref:hypothetical protein n=1 Tax=Rhizobium leguminosarum TaxID=384 RepID=UPI001C96E0B4|nr:hypothetical protein [Rhizobium leguminosarum]MBY5388492.1 hypothetical protein [Rhizobium leguminosarum]
MNENTFQRIADADEIDDAVVVRIWPLNGELVGEADFPTVEHAGTGQILSAALGNPVNVPQALSNAKRLLEELPMFGQRSIFVQIDEEGAWQADWGTLLPIKPSALTTKQFKP